MTVLQYFVIVCCAGVCACGRVDVYGDGGDSGEIYFLEDEDFETTENLGDISAVVKNDTDVVPDERSKYTIEQGGLNKSASDSRLKGSERVAQPVVFSYSSTTEPRVHNADRSQVNTLLQRHPATSGVRTRLVDSQIPRRRRYRVPVASHSLGTLVHYARILPKMSPEIESKLRFKKSSEDRPALKMTEEDKENEEEEDGGGEDKEEVEENERSGSEEDTSDNQGGEEKSAENQTSSEEYETKDNVNGEIEENESKLTDQDFLKEYVPSRKRSEINVKQISQRTVNEKLVDPVSQQPESSKIKQNVEIGVEENESKLTDEDLLKEYIPSRKRSKMNSKNISPRTIHEKLADSVYHQPDTSKIKQNGEVGVDKVLQEPLKFAYTEDLSPSESEQKKHHQSEFEKGGGEDSHADHHSGQGKKEEKGHESSLKYDTTQKGHHDKEAKEKKFSDQKGEKAKHKDEGGHFKLKKHEEKGKKDAKYEEKGAHKKGHSTKGEHNIHKKDEYVKKHEFYDEHHEGGEHEKHGGYHEKHGKKHGGKFKTGKKKSGFSEDHQGKKGHHKKGIHHGEHEGHKKKSGHQEHHEHKEKYGKEDGMKEGKKWRFHSKE